VDGGARRRRVLVLYSLTGAGHLRVAQALAAELRRVDPHCEIVLHDGLTGARWGIAFDPSRAYAILTTRLLWLFNVVYRLADTALGVRVVRSLIRWAWGRDLAAIIDRERPDLVVSTHAFFSPRTHDPTEHIPRWATVVTDLGTPPRLWFDARSDVLIAPTPEIAAQARQRGGVPANRILALDDEYPIDPRFQASSDSPARVATLLVLGGGIGAGKMWEQVSTLRRCFPRMKVVVVCGRNAALQARLARQADEGLEVHGFVDRMDELMRRADVVVSKAGSVTIAEAALMRKPLVITGWIGLQERDNVDLVVRRRIGLACPKPRDLPATIRRIEQDYEAFRRGGQVFRPGAATIARFLVGTGQL
jgi:UDP-N-acetylglucosamine:LPS N-acetylglucosamine transferase